MAQDIGNSNLLEVWASSGAAVEPDISKIEEGWKLGEQPPHEFMNWLQNTFGEKLNHVLSNGTPQWNSATSYGTGSTVQRTGSVWIAMQPNANSEPAAGNTNWSRLLKIADASSEADADKLVLRDANGTAKFSEPTDPAHPVRLQELEEHLSSTEAHTAGNLTYDPSGSTMTATKVQGVIDEAAARLDVIENIVVAESVATVSWNQATDTWTGAPQATDAHTAMRRCIVNSAGVVQYYLDEFDSTLQEDGETPAVLDGTDGQVMVEIAPFYVRTAFNGQVATWSVSPVPLPGYTLHPAFSGGVEKFYVGAYAAVVRQASTNTTIDGLNLDNNTGRVNLAADELWSASGNFPMVGLTRAEFRTLADNAGMQLYDFWQWQAVMMLFITEYGTWNSQAVLGRGNVDRSYPASSSNQGDSPHVAAGLSNSIGNGSGGIDDADGNPWVSYRGIENPWGNCWNWVDGWNIDNRQSYVNNDETTYADDTTTGYTVIGDALPTASDSPIKNWQYVENTFLVRQVGGGASTSAFVTDHFWTNTGWRVASVGGGADLDLRAGLACCSLTSGSAGRGRGVGARLSKKIRS